MLLVSAPPSRRVTSPAIVLPTMDDVAELPRVTVDTTYSAPGGTDHVCDTAAEFTTALANSVRGDTITLTAGNTFTGTFTLPAKSGTGWIYIRSSALASLPAGTRVDSGDTANMPTIVGAGSPVRAFVTSGAASHWRIAGCEIKCPTTPFCTTLIAIGNGETATADLPSYIIFDRCYIHGDPTIGGRRGVAMDGKHVAVIDSTVSDFKEVGADTQALWAYNTPGPIKIQNNYLSGAAENVMFGGSDPKITNCIPSDIEIRGNHFFKPTAWKAESWSVKNIFEIKNGQRVLIERNVFENIWAAAQAGFGFNLKSVNQGDTGGSGANWCTCKDITARYNKFIACEEGISIAGDASEGGLTAVPGARFSIHDNLVIVDKQTGTSARQMLIQPTSVDSISIFHNTFIDLDGGNGIGGSTGAGSNHVWKDNIFYKGAFGFNADGTAEGTTTINTWSPSTYTFTKNVIVAGSSGSYPANNFFPANTAAVGFTNYAGGDYTLDAGSAYKNAGSDGLDVGANVSLVETYASAAIAG